MIMGAAPNRTLTGRLLGTAKDRLTRDAECSVLWLKTPAQRTHELFDIKKIPVEKGFDLLDYVDENCISVNVDTTKKEQLFRNATDLLAQHYPEISPLLITTALWEREQLQNTAVGGGIAIPHATLAQASSTDSAVAIVTTKTPIDYDASNGEKVDVLFFTTDSPNNRQTHLKILAEISRLCQRADVLEALRNANSSEEVMSVLKRSIR